MSNRTPRFIALFLTFIFSLASASALYDPAAAGAPPTLKKKVKALKKIIELALKKITRLYRKNAEKR